MVEFNLDRHIMKDLIAREALQVLPEGQEFTLASGQKSRVFCDLKRVMLSGHAHVRLACLLYDVLAHGGFGAVGTVAGVAVGGCHLASIVAMYAALKGGTTLDVAYVRKEAKDHGTRQVVEAGLPTSPYRSVVLLEDVVTTGGSSLRAAEALQEAGFDVVGVLAVVDRRPVHPPFLEGKKNHIRFEALFELDELLEEFEKYVLVQKEEKRT